MAKCFEPVTEEQIQEIFSSLSCIYNMKECMRKKSGVEKTFALGGRFLGDVGECLASYLFSMTLCVQQNPGYDGRLQDGTRIEIKVRTENEDEKIRKIRISKESFNSGPNKEDKFYLVIFAFNFEKKRVKIALNKSVPTNSKINKDMAKSFNAWSKYFSEYADGPQIPQKNIAGWTILQEK